MTRAILTVLKYYQNRGWFGSCKDAIDSIDKFESGEELEDGEDDNEFVKKIQCPTTIMKWYHNFNVTNDQYFVNHYLQSRKSHLPPLLDNNPDVMSALRRFCNDNLITLSIEKYKIS